MRQYIKPETQLIHADMQAMLSASRDESNANDKYDLGNNNNENGEISTDGPDFSEGKSFDLWDLWDTEDWSL